MSLSEIKEAIPHLTVPELEELAVYIHLARKKRDPSWVERAVAIDAKMDIDGGIPEEALRALHERLSAAGK